MFLTMILYIILLICLRKTFNQIMKYNLICLVIFLFTYVYPPFHVGLPISYIYFFINWCIKNMLFRHDLPTTKLIWPSPISISVFILFSHAFFGLKIIYDPPVVITLFPYFLHWSNNQFLSLWYSLFCNKLLIK